MIDCCCGNPEGTNKECERCRLIETIDRLTELLRVSRGYIRAKRQRKALGWWLMLIRTVNALGDMETDTETESPEDQKRNDAMERGDYLRDRAKDEKQ